MHIPFSFRRGVALLLAGAALHSIGAARAHAQVPTALPDLNNDGVADYFMRLPAWSTTTDVVGQLRVFSGADNTLLKAFTSLQVDDGFALSTSSAGDLNADGVDDVLVGAPLAVGEGVVRGKVYAVSGADGVIIDVLVTPPWSYGGMTVAGIGDVDGGGLRDIAYSMRTATDAYEDTGLVVVHSTDTGEPALTLGGTLGDTSFGYAIAYLGDTNGDGSDEIAVSAPVDGGGPGSYGRVFVFECRGPDGSLRDAQTVADARLVIDNTSLPLAVFGGAMYLGPDLDGNGVRELVVGSTVFTGAAEVAVIQAYDLTTGAIIAALSIDSQKLSADINGDLIVDHRDVAEALDRMNQPADPLDPKSGDLDGDGLVDAGDVASVIDNLDQTFITPGTFSNGERAEVTELVTSLLFSQFFPCLGIGIGPGGGLVGITLPPEGPGGGGVIPEFPVNPDTVACCIARMFWLLYPPEDRPPLPSVCDDDNGPDGPGGPGDGGSPRPRPPGWTGEPGGGDDPPECDGMSVIGPTFVEVGGSASFTVNGAPAGFLMWDVYPYPTPYLLRPLVVSTRPVYSVEGVAPGSAMVIARIYENGAVVCGESWPVQVVDCEEMTLNGPGAVSVGAEATYTVQNLGGGVTVEWTITGDLTVVSTTGNSATVRGDSAGSGRFRARGMYQNEPLGCDLAIDVAVVCDFAVNGPATLQDGQVGTYTAHEQYAGQHVVWSASGPLAILGPTTGWGVQAQGTGCGAGVLTARLFDANGPTGCVVNYSVSVAGNAPTPLTLSGLPENGVIQLAPYESERVITLTAEGEGAFAWDIVTSVDGAVIVEHDGATCVLRILEPTHIAASVTRTYCGEQQTVQGEFTALVFDLAIDSDNDNGFDLPAQNEIEEQIEDSPSGMKVAVVNRGDSDGDYIPDYADGYGGFGPGSQIGPPSIRFVPVLVDLRGLPPNAQISFDYPASSPEELTRSDVIVADIESSYYRYHRPAGHLRLWDVEGHDTRTTENFIRANTPVPVSELGDFRVLYLEAVSGSSTPVPITMRATVGGEQILEDTVQVLPFDAVTGVSVPAIAGVGIHFGSAVGGPGVDIVFGSPGNDLIDTGAGDDIIVSGPGEDEIWPGEGEDILYSSRGTDTIEYVDLATLTDETEDINFNASDAPITTEQVLRVYKLLYGENDPWLRVFLAPEHVGGSIVCVEGDGVPFSQSDWDRVKVGGIWTYRIELEFSLQTPFLAATHLRQELLHLASSLFGPTLDFKAALEEGLELSFIDGQDDFDDILEIYDDIRIAAFDNATRATALVAGMYVQSIGIISEGTDIVISVSELSDGNLRAAIGLIPLLPSRLVDDATEGVLRIAQPGGGYVDEFVKRGRIFSGRDSGLGFIVRNDMPVDYRIVNNRLCLLIGTAQDTDGPNGAIHADLILQLARARIDVGDIEHAMMNRSMFTATGLEGLGTIRNLRPDVVAIRRDGKIDLIEVRSVSQSTDSVTTYLQDIWLGLPPDHRGSMWGVDLDGTYFFEFIQ
ncbi:MAG: hypothetical protein ACTS27_07400 [Phycisphaerales bacterium]